MKRTPMRLKAASRRSPLTICGRTCGEDFAALLRKQYGHYGRIIRETNIKAEWSIASARGR